MARPKRDPPHDEPEDRERLDYDPVDEPLDGDLLDDLTDDEPDGEVPDLDDPLLDDDSEAFDDLRDPEPPDLPLTELGELLLDEDTDEWALLEDDDQPLPPPPPDHVALPWSTRAQIPALQLDLPAILDPTRPDSEWRVAEPPERDRIEARVRVGPVEVRVVLKVVQAEPHGLVLGRDVLSGRILVRT